MAHREASVHWRGDMMFEAEAGGHSLILDTTPPHGHDRGPSPKLMLLVATAACTAMDVVGMLRKARQEITDVTVRADGYTVDSVPQRFERVVLTYIVKGTAIDAQAVERAVSLSEQKYCSVSATLREPTIIETRIEIDE